LEEVVMAIMRSSDYFYPSLPSLLNNFLRSGDLFDWTNSNFSAGNSTLPAINVKETENEFAIEVAAPGMQKDDFKINLERGILTISSEKREEKNQENGEGKFSRKEFSYQSFQRSFTVPEDMVDGENIQAKYSEGILYIALPKKEEVKPRPPKEIKIL
jgi:HSP20 family protein